MAFRHLSALVLASRSRRSSEMRSSGTGSGDGSKLRWRVLPRRMRRPIWTMSSSLAPRRSTRTLQPLPPISKTPCDGSKRLVPAHPGAGGKVVEGRHAAPSGEQATVVCQWFDLRGVTVEFSRGVAGNAIRPAQFASGGNIPSARHPISPSTLAYHRSAFAALLRSPRQSLHP